MKNKQNINCFRHDIEGIALYASSLDFVVEPILFFSKNTFTRSTIPSSKNRSVITDYEHTVDRVTIKFTPKITTFYSDDNCLVRILIPKTILTLEGSYLNHNGSAKVNLNIIEEAFLDISISSDELSNISMGFSTLNQMIYNKIKDYCNEQFLKLNPGIPDYKNEFTVKAKYAGTELKICFS